MDINAKKMEIIQHIIAMQDPEAIKKISRVIFSYDSEVEEDYVRKRTFEGKDKDNTRVGAKNKITSIFKISK